MTELIKRPNHESLMLGDIVRCTQAVTGSKGKRYKFMGAVFDKVDDSSPLYFELVDIKTGAARSIRPEHVVQEVAASKAARGRKARKEAK